MLGPEPCQFNGQKLRPYVFNITIVRNGVNTDLWIWPIISFRCSKKTIRANGIAFVRDVDNELFAPCEICDPQAFLENSSVRTEIKANDSFFFSEMRP